MKPMQLKQLQKILLYNITVFDYNGGTWGSLGGVKDVDQDTLITVKVLLELTKIHLLFKLEVQKLQWMQVVILICMIVRDKQ